MRGKAPTLLGLAVLSSGLGSFALLHARGARAPARGPVAAFVGGRPIYADDVRARAIARAAPRSFGAEERARPVSLAPVREPDDSEKVLALEKLIDDEALVQEALRRGYDRTEPSIRRRLVARIVEEANARDGVPHASCCCLEEAEPPADDRSRERMSRVTAEARQRAGTWIAPDALARLESAARSP